MNGPIFRQGALDRLANPERLDAAQHLVGRPAWVALAGLIALIVAGLAWATLTVVPLEVEARGVLVGRSGLAEVPAVEGGQVARILVQSGSILRQGDAVAELTRTDLQRDLSEARAKLEAAQQRFAGLSGFYSETASRDRGADRIRIEALNDSRTALRDRERFLLERIAGMRGLLERGFIPKDRLQAAEDDLAAVRERIAGLSEAGVRVTAEQNAKSGQARLALLEEQRTIDEQQRQIARLVAQLSERRFIRAGQSGQVTEIKVGVGDTVAAGAPVATIAPETDRSGLIAVLYVPAAQGKRLLPGMPAQVSPAGVERMVYGRIKGKVAAVAPLPATREGIRRVLRNDALVTQMFERGAPIEVRVELQRDPLTVSGYRWTASAGPDRRITPGTELSGAVEAERRRVVDLLWSTQGR